MRPKVDEKRIALRTHLTDDLPQFVKGDPTRLKQIFINLLGNAIKFTEEGEISIKSEVLSRNETETEVHFTVKDSGIGIPEEKLEEIFKSFTQAEGSTTREYGGTGLGLTISEQLVEMMNGRIWVESELGVGTAFHFTVQLHKGKPVGATKEQIKADINISKRGQKRLLVAEDNPINRRVIQLILDRSGYKFDMVEDGLKAVEGLTKQDYDLVLMDCLMPVMDGYLASEEIRRLGYNLPIIAATANAMREDIQRCLDSGMNGHISKPIRPKVVSPIIDEWLIQGMPLRMLTKKIQI